MSDAITGKLAGLLVAAAALYCIALAALSIWRPAQAARFLLGFVGTPLKHYAELALRLIMGWAFVTYSPRMAWPQMFNGFGWVLLVTTVLLLLIPWRWHQGIARRSVPLVIPHIRLLGVASLLLGLFMLLALGAGSNGYWAHAYATADIPA